MTLYSSQSIVAIDPTTRGVAFVWFEKGKVQDWGERQGRTEEAVFRAVNHLFDECAGAIVILENPDAVGCKRRARVRALLRAIKRQARDGGRGVVDVARRDVRNAWLARGVTRKEAMAAEIAATYPELEGVVPPSRKTGATEDPRVNVFDAASLALHVFASSDVVP